MAIVAPPVCCCKGTTQLIGRPGLGSTILMADAQTSGRYYRLVNVITSDMGHLAQLKPGDAVWFSLVSLEEAQLALKG